MPSTATTRTVTGLTNGTATVFRVAGVNALGTGAFSTASAAVTPTAAVTDPLFANVQLLLPGNTDVNDASSYSRSVTAVGATISTTHKQFGAGSINLEGDDGNYQNNRYLSIPTAASMNMPGDFAIEWWMRVPDINNVHPVLNTGSLQLLMNFGSGSPGRLTFFIQGVGNFLHLEGAPLQNNTWHYIAVSRSGSSNRLYCDGVQIGSAITNSESWVANTGTLLIGQRNSQLSTSWFLDDFRWTVGSDRGYTGATITVPAAAFPTS